MQLTQQPKPQVKWQDQANRAPMSGITIVRPIDQFLSPMKSILGQTSPNMALKAAEFEKDLRTERDNAIDAARRTQIAQQEADTDRWYKEQSLLAKYINSSSGNGYGSSGYSSGNPGELSWTDQNRAWDENYNKAMMHFSPSSFASPEDRYNAVLKNQDALIRTMGYDNANKLLKTTKDDMDEQYRTQNGQSPVSYGDRMWLYASQGITPDAAYFDSVGLNTAYNTNAATIEELPYGDANVLYNPATGESVQYVGNTAAPTFNFNPLNTAVGPYYPTVNPAAKGTIDSKGTWTPEAPAPADTSSIADWVSAKLGEYKFW